MKKLILALFTALTCYGQNHGTFKNPKWTDYDSHVHASGFITGGVQSSVYYFTKKPWLAFLAGVATSLTVGVVGKEYIHDKYMSLGDFSRRDIDGDVTGTAMYALVTSGWINTIKTKREKRAMLDTLKYNFNPRIIQ
jgi:hypothetical protein